jgi:plastocyanin
MLGTRMKGVPSDVRAAIRPTVHTATVRDDWDVTIEANKSATLVLQKAGAVVYYCRFHPNMNGRIIVKPN